jgi:hypothetical protein
MFGRITSRACRTSVGAMRRSVQTATRCSAAVASSSARTQTTITKTASAVSTYSSYQCSSVISASTSRATPELSTGGRGMRLTLNSSSVSMSIPNMSADYTFNPFSMLVGSCDGRCIQLWICSTFVILLLLFRVSFSPFFFLFFFFFFFLFPFISPPLPSLLPTDIIHSVQCEFCFYVLYLLYFFLLFFCVLSPLWSTFSDDDGTYVSRLFHFVR